MDPIMRVIEHIIMKERPYIIY